MCRHPVLDLSKPVGNRSSIENVTACVTEVRLGGIGRPLDLCLQKPHTIVELCRNIILLVRSDVVWCDERRVMASNFRDVAVLPHTEFGVIVAGLGISDCRCGASR